jgi:SAM-dependent methyltransferase
MNETFPSQKTAKARRFMPGIEKTRRKPQRESYVAFDNVETRNEMQSRFEIPLMLMMLRPPRGGRVLEIGCGRGVALPVLATLLTPSRLVGVDVNPLLVEIANERMLTMRISAQVLRGDIRALPLDSASFDLVIDFGTCYHVSGGANGARAALAEVARVLRPGGLFVHETPVAQQLAHPVRSFGRRLPWKTTPELRPYRRAVLWSMRRKNDSTLSQL